MKKAGIALATVVVLYFILSVAGSIFIMRVPRLSVNTTPASVGLAYDNVSFPSRGDGVLLKGWYLPGQGHSIIIVVHGGYQNRLDDNVDTLGLARDLIQRGYDILLFDLRGRGESAGTAHALMNFQQDIGGAVDFAGSKGYLRDNIGIIGFCSGAISTCIYAGENDDVGAIVLDGCSTTVRNMVYAQAKDRGIPKFLVSIFMPGLTSLTKLFYHYHEVDPIDVIANVNCPIFFIHEEKDNFVSRAEMSRLFSVSKNPANQIWEIANALHSQGYKEDPLQYIDHLDGFFTSTLINDSVLIGQNDLFPQVGVLAP
jgi:pimeloyl-ACP methyl ester carboxylesterase